MRPLLTATAIFFIYTISHAQSLEHWPDWDLSTTVEDSTGVEKKKYFLEPPDGRPTIGVSDSVAERLLAGTINPEDVYRDKKISTTPPALEEESPSSISSTNSSSAPSFHAMNSGNSAPPISAPPRAQAPKPFIPAPTNSAPPSNNVVNANPTPKSGGPKIVSSGASVSGSKKEEDFPKIEMDQNFEQNVSSKNLRIVPQKPIRKRFNLTATSCGNKTGYCSCVTPNQIYVPYEASAKNYCKSMGYTSLFDYSTMDGPVGAKICMAAKGTACFINRNPGNLVCKVIICQK